MNSRILFIYALCISCLICGCGIGSTTQTDETGGSGGGTAEGGSGGDSGSDADAEVDADADSVETPSDDPYECIFPSKSLEKATNLVESCGTYKCSTLIGCKWPPCDSNDDCVASTLELGWELEFPVVCNEAFVCTAQTPSHHGDDPGD